MNRKQNILITGTQGLIGWNLYNLLPRSKYNLFAFSKHEEPRSTAWYQGLIEDPDRVTALLRKVQPDIIIHTHAVCNLDVCEQDIERTQLINVKGTRVLLDALDKKTYFIYMSSEHVFSGNKGNYHERDLCDPISVYGKTRIQAEKMVNASTAETLIIRPGLVIGGSLQGNVGPLDWLKWRLTHRRPASYFTDEYRSPIQAESFTRGLDFLISKRAVGTYHIGGKNRMSRYELALHLAKELSLEGDIRAKQRSDDHDVPRIGDCSLDSGKINMLGWAVPSFSRL